MRAGVEINVPPAVLSLHCAPVLERVTPCLSRAAPPGVRGFELSVWLNGLKTDRLLHVINCKPPLEPKGECASICTDRRHIRYLSGEWRLGWGESVGEGSRSNEARLTPIRPNHSQRRPARSAGTPTMQHLWSGQSLG